MGIRILCGKFCLRFPHRGRVPRNGYSSTNSLQRHTTHPKVVGHLVDAEAEPLQSLLHRGGGYFLLLPSEDIAFPRRAARQMGGAATTALQLHGHLQQASAHRPQRGCGGVGIFGVDGICHNAGLHGRRCQLGGGVGLGSGGPGPGRTPARRHRSPPWRLALRLTDDAAGRAAERKDLKGPRCRGERARRSRARVGGRRNKEREPRATRDAGRQSDP